MKKGEEIKFEDINLIALKLYDLIETNKEKLISILTKYETYLTAEDEISRSLDLLKNLEKNKEYFKERIGKVAVFIPSNQPLYSYVCFGFIPSIMSEKVFIKSPEIMSHFYYDMANMLTLKNHENNIQVMNAPRSECIEYFTKTFLNKNNEITPEFELVIFTGTTKNAELLRKKFHKSVLFISNGSGNNPIVVTESADIDKACESILHVCTYNQGQDCASPSAILVHKQVYETVLENLRSKIKNLTIGPYHDRETNIGPISRPKTISQISKFLLDNSKYIDSGTPGIIKIQENIVEPTIICKPLKFGANYEEIFAPIFYIQKYEEDEELELYFDQPEYEENSMYITVYGKSEYISNFVTNNQKGKRLNDENTVIYNSDLHQVERGFLPYGGYGRGASSITKDGIFITKPILPQREIYEYLVLKKPLAILKAKKENISKAIKKKKEIKYLNINDLKNIFPKEILINLCFKNFKHKISKEGILYDVTQIFKEFQDEGDLLFSDIVSILQSVNFNESKFFEYLKEKDYQYNIEEVKFILKSISYLKTNFGIDFKKEILLNKNEEYLSNLSDEELESIKEVKNYIFNINNQKDIKLTEIEKNLYSISKKTRNQNFFKNLYHLLFNSENGPKLAPFIWSGDKDKIIELLETKKYEK